MEQMMNKLQNLKVKTSIKFHRDLSNFCDELNYLRQNIHFTFEEDTSSKNALGIAFIRKERLSIVNFFPAKSQVKDNIT